VRGGSMRPHPSAPVAVRPNNLASTPEPRRSRRAQFMKQPSEVQARRESFKRNREAAMRRLMR
jgi:hypothetical protein